MVNSNLIKLFTKVECSQAKRPVDFEQMYYIIDSYSILSVAFVTLYSTRISNFEICFSTHEILLQTGFLTRPQVLYVFAPVSQSVCNKKFSYFPSLVFSVFLQQVSLFQV